MFEAGLARPDSLSLGLDLGDDYRRVGKDGVATAIFFAPGPPIRGSLWETTAVPDIREQCEPVARHLTGTAAWGATTGGDCLGTRGRSQPLAGA